MSPAAPQNELLVHRITKLEAADEKRAKSDEEIREVLFGLRTELALQGERLKGVATDVSEVKGDMHTVKAAAQSPPSPIHGAVAGATGGGAVSVVAVFFADALRRLFGG